MVARDGIEPPTPAFSGPRSTTELSGLGNSKDAALASARAAYRMSEKKVGQNLSGPAGDNLTSNNLTQYSKSHQAKRTVCLWYPAPEGKTMCRLPMLEPLTSYPTAAPSAWIAERTPFTRRGKS
jgi:hypothetical protein